MERELGEKKYGAKLALWNEYQITKITTVFMCMEEYKPVSTKGKTSNELSLPYLLTEHIIKFIETQVHINFVTNVLFLGGQFPSAK